MPKALWILLLTLITNSLPAQSHGREAGLFTHSSLHILTGYPAAPVSMSVFYRNSLNEISAGIDCYNPSTYKPEVMFGWNLGLRHFMTKHFFMGYYLHQLRYCDGFTKAHRYPEAAKDPQALTNKVRSLRVGILAGFHWRLFERSEISVCAGGGANYFILHANEYYTQFNNQGPHPNEGKNLKWMGYIQAGWSFALWQKK